VVVKLAPDPVDGLPPGADQENVKVPVPPVAEASHVTGLPAVADPQLTVTVIPEIPGVTVTSCVAVAVALFASVAVSTTWNVVVEVTVYACWTGLPEPGAELSPKSQLNEYGDEPPVPEAVKVTDCPELGVAGRKVKSAVKGWAATVTVAVPLAVMLLASVTLNVSVKVPFACSVLEMLPVPV